MIDSIKRRALHRARIINGQINGLEKQIEEDAYCINILTQSLAIQKSLASLSKLVLENHLRTHVTDNLSLGDKDMQNRTIGELLDLYELNNIRGK